MGFGFYHGHIRYHGYLCHNNNNDVFTHVAANMLLLRKQCLSCFAADEDELSFDPDDIITNIEKVSSFCSVYLCYTAA